MLRRTLAHAVVLAGISVMLGVLAVLDVGRVGLIAGAQYVDRMAYCPASSCEGAAQVQLPFLTSFRYDPGIERHVLQTAVQSAAEDGRVEAIYVPKYSDRLQIRVNGALIHTDPDRRRPWNAPLLIEVPPYLLMAGENIVTLVLTGDVPGRLDLHPISFGDQAVLSRAYDARQMLGPGATRFSLTMMGLLTLGFLVVWSNRPRDRLFLWIGLSCGCACMYLSLLAFSFSVGGYKNWKLLQSASMAGYALFMLAFVRAFLALPVLRSEKVLAGLVALGLIATFVVPIHQVNMTSMVVNISSVWAAVTIVVVMWERRRLVPTVDFLVFFPTLSLALAFAFDGLVHNLSGAPPSSMHLLHLMPLLTSAICLWLILSQLLRSLNQHEALAASLQDTIAEKSRALEASYAQVAQARQAQAVEAERARILLDLHDGVGGQLVNTLAYIEASDIEDPTLRDALESVLRDLALMLDSIENHDSLATLLAMMRHRQEALLARHGITFDWQIMAEPEWAEATSSSALQIARIVQEAITNVIRHAGATNITVHIDRSRVCVSDDGTGFDVAKMTQASAGGYGLPGMQRRAAAIGAALSVHSDAQGTRIALDFPLPGAGA